MLKWAKEFIFQSSWWQRHGKNRRELNYWRGNAERMEAWYRGEQPFRLPYPDASNMETRFHERKNAIMTYIALETQLASYRSDLLLRADSLAGKRVADIGSGPMPTLNVFHDCERYCLDHLIDVYRQLGYPLDEFEERTTFVNAKSECIPFADGFFDVVLSRNALDHVDDFEATSREILRVLGENGWLHVQLHYHAPTSTEPQRLDDETVRRNLPIPELRKIREDHGQWGFENGRTVVWSNIPDQCLARFEVSSAQESALVG